MKLRKCIVSIVSAAFFLFGVYLMQISSVKVIRLEKTFTFLTLESEGVEACVAQVQLDGGAGFLLKTEDGEKVALSVYLKEENGILVKERLSQKYDFLKIIKKQPAALYFKGLQEKQRAKSIHGAFVNLYTMIQRLENIIDTLSNGGTQESCRRELSALSTCFSTFSRSYEDVFKEFSIVCKNATKSLNKSVERICYAKNLRYILCELCEEYVVLSHQFQI